MGASWDEIKNYFFYRLHQNTTIDHKIFFGNLWEKFLTPKTQYHTSGDTVKTHNRKFALIHF